MILHPCYHCTKRVEGCDRHAETLKNSRNLDITSARIKCEDYRNLFRKGQRVQVKHPQSRVWRSGTVKGCLKSSHKYVVWLDEENMFSGNRRTLPEEYSLSDLSAPERESLLHTVYFYPRFLRNICIKALDEPDYECAEYPWNKVRYAIRDWD